MKCTRCGKGKAIRDSQLGILPCNKCQKEEESFNKPELGPEFSTDSIKEGRREYYKDAIQPFRDGIFSAEFYDEYGTTGVKVTKEQIKNRKYVWKDTAGHWNRNKGKGGGKGRKTEKFLEP